jgi:restriction system protein
VIEKKKKPVQAEFLKWFNPVLEALRDLGGSGQPKEVYETVARMQKVPDSVREETMKSGVLRFNNQIAWARQYLIWEGYLDNSKRGVWTLSIKGQNKVFSKDEPREIFLKWVAFHTKQKIGQEKETPKAIIEKIEDEISVETSNLTSLSLLEVLQSITPTGFEHICKRLLREHGFENVIVTQASRDEGIDGYGTLELNPFVSIKVLFQCKRYKGTVSRAQVGDFRNAMIGRAEKGIILTTGTFSEDAKREASRDGAPPIELIDGKKLVELFESVELGVKPKTIYEVEYSFFEQYLSK